MLDEQFFPSGVCVTCYTAIISAYQLKELVQNADYMWKKAIHNFNSLPEDFRPNIKSVYAFVSKESLEMRVVHDYSGEEPTNVLNNLTGGLPRKRQSNIKYKKKKPSKNGPSCVCNDCGQVFFGPYYLSQHLKNSGQKEACLICGLVFIRGKDMKEHMYFAHREVVHLCKDCPLWFTQEAELKDHVKTAHRVGALTCSDCGRNFPRQAALEAHSQMHAVRTCRTCGKQFTNRGCYRKHRSLCEPDAKPDPQKVPRNKRKNVRDPAKFICDYCGKEYRSRPQLKNHILWIHMNVRPHQCQWCGKRFYTIARLNEHRVVHTRERNFACDICGMKLVSKMAAVYHRRRHTGEKPYKCDECNETFISSSRRSEHAKRRHNKGPRFACPQCPLTFVRSLVLRKHIEKAHSSNVSVFVKPKSIMNEAQSMAIGSATIMISSQ